MRQSLCAILLVMAGCATTGGSDSQSSVPPEAQLVKDIGVRLYGFDIIDEDLDAGAGVYVGEVVASQRLGGFPPRDGDPSGAALEFGIATIRVTQTLCGPARHELRLPYNLVYGEEANWTSSVRWPDFHSEPRPLLMVVVPGGYDEHVGQQPGLDGAARWILGAVPGVPQAMQRILRLREQWRQIKDPDELELSIHKAVLRGLADDPENDYSGYEDDKLVRDYATHAAMTIYAKAPHAGIDILSDRIRLVYEARDHEVSAVIRAMGSMVWAGHHEPGWPSEANKAALRRLLDMLGRPGAEQVSEQTHTILREVGPDDHVDATELGGAAWRQGTATRLAEIAATAAQTGDKDWCFQLQRVPALIAWLNKPPIPATQPAATQPAVPGR